MEELLSLKWNNHRSTFLHILTILRNKELYTDVTLACEGRFYSVHKLVLSTCSDYFSAIFERTTCKNPTIVLKDIKCEDLEALLDYMYLGEVNVRQADLASLIKAAECLRVKGLAVPDDEPPKKGSHSDSSVRRPDGITSPPAKRKRRSEDQDGRDDVRPTNVRSPSLSSQPKSVHSHSRLSPIHDSESGRSSPHLSDGNQNSILQPSEDGQIKIERDDNSASLIDDNYDLANDNFKEEPNADPGGDLSNDLPEFLQQASGSSYSHSYGGPSFQPDLQNWQGDQVLGSNYSGMGFNASQSQDGSQSTSTPGIDEDFTEEKPFVCASETATNDFTPQVIKYRVRGRPRKNKGKVSPLVISKVSDERVTLKDYVPELGKSVVEMMAGLNLRLMEELLLMGFPCAICKTNEIFSNLEDHLTSDHKMSLEIAEEYIDIMMNKISDMITEMKDEGEDVKAQNTVSKNKGASLPSTKPREPLTLYNLPLADHIFLTKYKAFLDDELSHISPATARIYKRKASEMILFFRQNGISFSESPIRSQEDVSTIVSILWKFCTSRSVFSLTTLKQRMQFFNLFMNHFYKEFYDTDASLIKSLNKQLRQIPVRLKQVKLPTIGSTGILKGKKKLDVNLTKISKFLTPIVKIEKQESLEMGLSGNKDLNSFIIPSLTQGDPSTSGLHKKRHMKKPSLLAKRGSFLKKSAKEKGIAEFLKKPLTSERIKGKLSDPLLKNAIYRKYIKLLQQDETLAHDACKTRNAVLFAFSDRKRFNTRALCEMTLGDFRNATWSIGPRAFEVSIRDSPEYPPLLINNKIYRNVSNWITKYRGFISSDTSNEAPLFVTDSGSKLSPKLVCTMNSTFAKLCGFSLMTLRRSKGISQHISQPLMKEVEEIVEDQPALDQQEEESSATEEEEEVNHNIKEDKKDIEEAEQKLPIQSSLFYPRD